MDTDMYGQGHGHMTMISFQPINSHQNYLQCIRGNVLTHAGAFILLL
jgi:hypothetical protein